MIMGECKVFLEREMVSDIAFCPITVTLVYNVLSKISAQKFPVVTGMYRYRSTRYNANNYAIRKRSMDLQLATGPPRLH